MLIDVHHHMFPPSWLEQAGAGIRRSTRRWQVPYEWTAEASLGAMDHARVDRAVLSLGTPGMAAVPPNRRAEIARDCNLFGADLRARYPDRFGFFATLPLPDVAASLVEIDHALDGLGADGVGLMSNEDGIWLGDDRFAPVIEALDARAAVVYVHPAAAPQLDGHLPDIPTAMPEFPVDTARAILTLLLSGRLATCSRIRFIFSHAGGVLPALAGRVAALGPRDPQFGRAVPDGALATLGRLHFDVAGAANDFALAPATALVSQAQLLFGSDFPYLAIDDTKVDLARSRVLAGHTERFGRAAAAALWPGFVT